MTAFADWQETREPWILFGVTSIILVLLAHYLFQGWLYMLPCEQCVYIRYGNIVMAIGAFLITINPKQALLKIAGIGVFLYGLIYTMICSWKLMGIHDAVHSDDPMAMFGMQGCSTEPSARQVGSRLVQADGRLRLRRPRRARRHPARRLPALAHRGLSGERRLVPLPAVEVHGHG